MTRSQLWAQFYCAWVTKPLAYCSNEAFGQMADAAIEEFEQRFPDALPPPCTRCKGEDTQPVRADNTRAPIWECNACGATFYRERDVKQVEREREPVAVLYRDEGECRAEALAEARKLGEGKHWLYVGR